MAHSVLFISGSAIGAFIAWLIGRAEPGRLAVAATIGVVSFMSGFVTVTLQDWAALAADASLGFVGAVAPLTLCLKPMSQGGTVSEMATAVGDRAAALGVALLWGTGCGAVGFAAAQSVQLLLGGRS
jgi:hypothetical protein